MQQISIWLTTLIYYYYLTNHTIQVTAVLDEEEGNNELREQLVASKTITIEGTEVYKASVIKQMFSTEGLSKDRLKRVRGMTRTDSMYY